jgi:hypothetical protein
VGKRPEETLEGAPGGTKGLVGQRLIDFIETRLEEEGCEKVVPAEDDLGDAYRRAVVIARINSGIEEIMENLNRDGVVPPDDLREQVLDRLDQTPVLSWDEVIASLVEEIQA